MIAYNNRRPFLDQKKAKTEFHSNNCTFIGDNMEESYESKANYNNHYHLGEKNPNVINIMSGIRSLICDTNGIVIAEMVYRCMICDALYETIPEVQIHYQSKHINEELKNISQNNSSNEQNITNTSLTPKSRSNVSFLGSFRNITDINLDSNTDLSLNNTNTLTFDVPSGLKTLQQQFQTEKEAKKKNEKLKHTNGSVAYTKSKTGLANKPKGQLMSSLKSGFITCEICNATKFYKYLQRRFGVYSCVGCAKFYSKYLLKPINYTCENLGKCNLKVSECDSNGRCKACLVHKCKSKFTVDRKKLPNSSRLGLIQSKSNGKKGFGEKSKRHNKAVVTKDLNRTIKGRLSNGSTVLLKTKQNSNKNRFNTENSLIQNKAQNILISSKRTKSEKNNQKVIHEKKEPKNDKTVTQTINVGKISVSKASIARRLQRKCFPSVKLEKEKSSDRLPNKSPTKTRQTSCRKCVGCKTRNCNNCVNCLDRPRNGGKDKIRQKCIKRKCLNRLP